MFENNKFISNNFSALFLDLNVINEFIFIYVLKPKLYII
jgi:hypothetical protein